MIKLWNHSLLDARTMNTCNIILDGFKNESPDPKQIWFIENIGQLEVEWVGADSGHFKGYFRTKSFNWKLET